jgi:prophage ps3 protein 01
MYNVLDICHYVINYCNDKGYSISNLKLQKLLYFIQAYFLISTNKACFHEDIEAWNFGPVIREAYMEYKKYGGLDIPHLDSYLVIDKNNLWDLKRIPINTDMISKKHKQMINDVVDKFSPYSATDLVDLTHRQAPWKNAYVPHKNNIITLDALKEYFHD